MKTKEQAIKEFVERDFSSIPQDWVKAVMDSHNEAWSLPMWGTMFIVNFGSWGERLWKNAVEVVSPEECENHDKNTTCQNCEDYEEMGGAMNIRDKDGNSTAAYIYDVEGIYVVGINGAGWNFYDGVWDRLYDFFELKWHDEKETYTDKTLGELVSSENETIKRNAMSILKQLQK
jgi:hypothetical protein